MTNRIATFSVLVLAVALAMTALCATQAAAVTEKILHQFNQLEHGSFLNGIVPDAQGNLYGTTTYGGAYNHGAVFKLTPNTHGGWTETVLYSFTGGSDGNGPECGVTLDSAGNIYGTTLLGGAFNDGTVF